MKSFFIYWFVLFAFTGCSTMGEVFSGDLGDYHPEVDSEGHTRYVRERVINNDTWTDYSLPHIPLMSLEDSQNLKTQSEKTSDFSSGIILAVLGGNNAGNIDLSYEWRSDYVSGGVGISYLGSDKNYFGSTGGFRVHGPWPVSPFVGIGGYLGDSKSCSHEPLTYSYSYERCEKYFLISMSMDAGVQFIASQEVTLRLFARQFQQARQSDELSTVLYGLSVGVYF